MTPLEIKEAIRRQALEVGFSVAAFAPAATTERQKLDLAQYLKEGRHASMEWMAETEQRRNDPRGLWKDVRSVIVLGLNHAPAWNPLDHLKLKDRGAISAYAKGKDYHDVVKKRLKQLARWMVDSFGNELKVFVDTAPVMEKPLASASGLGWAGKHTNVVSRDFGCWLFLGEIFTTLDLPPDMAEPDHCGSCTKCLDICPTDAFDGPRKIDARKCISYLTIEHHGDIDPQLAEKMGNRIYGCDDCMSICPWNKFAPIHSEEAFFPRPETFAPRLADIAALNDPDFRTIFAQTPVKRTGRNRMVRNALIAMGNSGDKAFEGQIKGLINDEAEEVKNAAIWALKKLKT